MQDGLIYDTLLHEWAHAITYPFYHRNQDPHDETFWITYGKMYRRWHDEGGAEASRGL